MENSFQKNVLSGFAYALATSGLLDQQAALEALKETTDNKTSYIDFLIRQRLADETQVARVASEYFGLPLCDINAFNLDLIPSEYLNLQIVRRRHGLPLFKKSGLLYLAIVDPTLENLYEIRFLTGLEVRLLIVEASKLKILIDELLNTVILSEIIGTTEETAASSIAETHKDDTHDPTAFDVESTPVINYVNKILMDAIDKNASDIHFERYEGSYRIRFRQNGVLYPIGTPPLKLANYLLARIKVMSALDITEHRIPQDGRFKFILPNKRSADFRVSVCPTLYGEKIVLRLLDPSHMFHDIASLGMDESQVKHFELTLQRSQGMILVTGPTGSGKTVTLYSGLAFLNSPEKNISTVEDPVEIPMQGINQVHVNPKAGMTFSVALRAFLRQDPDIIMVGEIRDLETAEIAIKASQTGHLVLSTLHTNSAPETITRLLNMGVATYNLASSLTLIIAQRLVRVLCENCKVAEEYPPEVLEKQGFKKSEIPSLKLYGPGSCDYCIHGFVSRIGIFEVLPVSPEMEILIMKGGSSIEIIKQAKEEKVKNLRESGLEKVKAGITSLKELNRVFT